MGRRTLTAHSLEFHQKRQVGRTYAPANLNGLDLLDEFQKWLTNLQPNGLHDPANNLWVRVAGYKTTLMRRFILVDVEVGSYGETGAVVDSRSGSILMPLTADQAPTGITRAVLYVPEHGGTALFFSEYSGRGSGGSRLLRAFATHWSRMYDFTMVQQAVTEGEAWADAAELKEVEVRVRRHSSDIADPAEETLAVYSHVLRPPRGKFLRRNLLGELRERRGRAAAAVGLDSMPENSEVLVTLRNREGRQKKFVLGEGDALPALREELNGPGEPILSDAGLLEVCADKASDLLDRL